jgi:hypothetical protein
VKSTHYIIAALLALVLGQSALFASIWVGRTGKDGQWHEWETVGEATTVTGIDGNLRIWSEETENGTLFHIVAEANDVIGGTLIPDMNLRFRGNYQVDVRFEPWEVN